MVSVESVIHIAIQWTSVWETIVLSSGQMVDCVIFQTNHQLVDKCKGNQRYPMNEDLSGGSESVG